MPADFQYLICELPGITCGASIGVIGVGSADIIDDMTEPRRAKRDGLGVWERGVWFGASADSTDWGVEGRSIDAAAGGGDAGVPGPLVGSTC